MLLSTSYLSVSKVLSRLSGFYGSLPYSGLLSIANWKKNKETQGEVEIIKDVGLNIMSETEMRKNQLTY
jgi:hypothetical protein